MVSGKMVEKSLLFDVFVIGISIIHICLIDRGFWWTLRLFRRQGLKSMAGGLGAPSGPEARHYIKIFLLVTQSQWVAAP
jgi:hypothetical protein